MAYNYLKKIAYFYPRPPRGGRLDSDFRSLWDKLFLSTPSARRATKGAADTKTSKVYFYPRPPRGGRPQSGGSFLYEHRISIHALREEGDGGSYSAGRNGQISIHALREEGDCQTRLHLSAPEDFYPRPPRGGRPDAAGHGRTLEAISIHALREEGDWRQEVTLCRTENFYPRPPRGGRPTCRIGSNSPCYFYPRPPRGGRLARFEPPSPRKYFYPRPPRGGRPYADGTVEVVEVFLSTPSARRATPWITPRPRRRCISIHALREEGDPTATLVETS